MLRLLKLPPVFLSSEGGYAAHASVVARQYGKVSLVNHDIKFKGKKIQIGDITL